MNFHVRDDFKAGAPVSQVPASWYNAVAAFINNLVGGRGIELDKKQNGTSVIALKDEYREVSRLVGTPEDKSDTGTDDDQDGSTWEWVHDNKDGKGLIVTPYCKIEDEQGWHYFGRVKMTFSKSGLLMKAEGLAGRREIQA